MEELEPPNPAASAATPAKRWLPCVAGFSPQPPRQFAGWSQSSASPSPSPRWVVPPHYSPGYADADHGGFNPNTTFPLQPMMYVGGSPATPPILG